MSRSNNYVFKALTQRAAIQVLIVIAMSAISVAYIATRQAVFSKGPSSDTPVLMPIATQLTEPATSTATDAPRPSATYSVNTTNDTIAGACDVSHCSLREAIIAANASAGLDTINFNIPGSAVHTISPTSILPSITDAVIIDGYTQPGAAANTNATGSVNAVLKIQLSGTLAGPEANGLTITGGNTTVRGLVINGFGGNGIHLDGNSGNSIAGNFIGTGIDGTSDLGNALDGVLISNSASNSIGGSASGARNVISRNGRRGIAVTGPTAILNSFSGNAMSSNDALGVDLGGDGRTLNDNDDIDAGPNNLLNFPAIISASVNVVRASYNGLPNATFRIEFFVNDVADLSGFGEGQSLLGTLNVENGPTGDSGDIFFTSPENLSGRIVSATATRMVNGNPLETSEFSNAFQATIGCSTQVTTTADNGSNSSPSPGSLRAAISCSNATAGVQTIGFGAGVTGTISLKQFQLTITDSTNIDGPGASSLEVYGDPSEPAGGGTFVLKRVFEITAGNTVSISGLTIRGGRDISRNGNPVGRGGGILNFGTLTLNDCVLRDNLADGSSISTGQTGNGGNAAGGGIGNAGTLTLNRCWIHRNLARGGRRGSGTSDSNGVGRGAGVANLSATSVLVVNDSTFSENDAEHSVRGTTDATGAGQGAAIYNAASADVIISNSTISGNSASGGNDAGGSGGGAAFIESGGDVTFKNSTLANNNASAGGGLYILNGATVTLSSTIVARNLAGAGLAPDVRGLLISSSAFNLIGDGTGLSGISNSVNGNIVGTSVEPVNPLLFKLQLDGGPTPTHLLLSGSPALDKGTANGLTADQRGPGFPRISDAPSISNASDGTDIGAVEQNQNIAACSTVVTDAADSGPGSLREAIVCSNNTPGRDIVSFNISGIGPHTINLSVPLPALADEVTIDGYTQPGSSVNTQALGTDAVLKVIVSSLNIPAGTAAPVIFDVQTGEVADSEGSTLRGLVIQPGNAGGTRTDSGITLGGRGNHTVEGCFIGTNATGTAGSPGVGMLGISVVHSNNNRIGGSTPAARNLISNNLTGVRPFQADDTLIENNLVGTNAVGTGAIGNSQGVCDSGSNRTRIVANVISGNTRVSNSGFPAGLVLESAQVFDAEVRGNLIGTDNTGTSALPNGTGIVLHATGRVSGG